MNWRMISAAVIAVVANTSIWAQSSGTGAVKGTITDQSGAVITMAAITLTNTATGQARSTVSDGSGGYSFSFLPPATYSVSASAAGFKTVSVSVTVKVTEIQGLDLKLEVGSQEQMVLVTTNTDTVQTESATMGDVVGTLSINSLPLVTRNYTQILSLSPGVVSDVNDATSIGRGSQFVYVNGSTNAGTSYYMDGMSVNNYPSSGPKDIGNGFFGYLPIPSPDSLQEFKVQTSGYDASFGRNSGANVNVVTKSGTKDFHGSLFEFFRNDALNANTFFRNRTGQPRGVLKQNQFGGTVGGPIKRDKLFFFLSYQGTRQVNGIAAPDASSSVTLPAQLTNNRTRAALGAAFCPANNPIINTRTFTTGAPNPASDQVACDGSNINPVALYLLNAKLPNGQFQIPTPQTILNAGTSRAVGLAAFSIPAKFSEDQALVNLDYVITPKHSLAVKYYYSIAPTVSAFSAAGQPPSGGVRGLSGNNLIAGRFTSILSNSLVNEFRLSSNYIRATVNTLVTTTTAEAGMIPAHPTSTLIPQINITGLFGNFGRNVDGPADSPSTTYEWSDQLSWTHNSHTFRMGFDEQIVSWYLCSCGKTRGILTFNTFSDFLLGMSAAENGTSLSNIFNSNTSVQLYSSPNTIRQNQLSAFFQDDFKVSKRLTLNLGLRWEYDGSAWDTNRQGGTNTSWEDVQSVPVPPIGGTYVGFNVAKDYEGPVPPGVKRRSTNLLTEGHQPFTNFAPRIGFAWQPFSESGRFVVRGGYGWYYEVVQGNAWDQTFIYTPPNTAFLNYSGTANALARFADPFNPKVAPGNFDTNLRTRTSNLSFRGTDPHALTPVTQSWNLNIEFAIKPTLSIEIGYVGSAAKDIFIPQLLNIPQLATASNPVNCTFPSGCITTNTAANAAQRVPVLGLTSAGFQLMSNEGHSNYNSVQATLRKTFSHGLQFQAAYTYGRNFSNLSGINFIGGVGGSTNSNDPSDLDQMYGPTDYYRPHRLVVNYVYRFPDVRHNRGFLGKSLSNWGVSGVTIAQSGLPITITDTRGGAVYGFAGVSRAQLCPGMTYADLATSGSVQSRITGYFNTAALCPVPVIGQVNGVGGATGYGNTGRNILSGPRQTNFDFSVSKMIKVGVLSESGTLEFRSEFFNLFNHPNFSNPAANLASPTTFGVITTTSNSPRTIQFALRYSF
jgi:hypothetical protein